MTNRIIIAKNIRSYDVSIEDLGLIIYSLNQRDLSEVFNEDIIFNSDDLKYEIEVTGDIVINDGISDLSSTDALNYVESITIFETADGGDEIAIHENVSGEINNIPEKNPPINTDIIIIEDSADSFSKKKVKINNLPSGGGGSTVSDDIHINLSSRWDPYFYSKNTSWIVATQFIFKGTDYLLSNPSSIKVISKVETSYTAEVRLFDSTNSNEICSFNISTIVFGIYTTTTISNLPAGESIFELQCKGNGSKNVFLSSLMIIF